VGALAVVGWTAGSATAQAAPRLVDSIEAPMLYVALDATAGAAGRGRAGGAVQRLLADPAFDAVLSGGRPGAGRSGAGDSSSARATALVRGVLSRSSGELEIALTGVVPGVGQPLLVLRAQLQQDEAGRLQSRLREAAAELAEPCRELHGRQTYAMLGADGRQAAGPGQQVEIALVGNDLVVANDTTAMEEMLTPQRRTSATRRVLSSDPRFMRLRERMSMEAGSLLVYGDWQRLGKRLQSGDLGDALWMPTFVLRWSGLNTARAVMASLSGTKDDFTGTVLLDFDGKRAGGRRGSGLGDADINGWFSSALSIPARTLVRDLPGGGLGGLVMAVDLRDIAVQSRRGAQLLRHLRDSFRAFGLDFERNVLSRLGERGTVQLLFRRGEGGATTEINSVYSVRATSREAASDLFKDLRRSAVQRGTGRLLEDRLRRGVEVLELRHDKKRESPPTFVAVHGDSVLVAFDPVTIDEFLVEARKGGRQRGRRDVAVGNVIQEIGGSDVSGLFDLDFTPWLDHLASLLSAGNTAVDLSGIPRRHIGYLDLQPRDPDHDESGVVLRICVMSSR